MGFSTPSSPGPDSAPDSAPVADPRLQPTPDWGTLGPAMNESGSGVAGFGANPQQVSARKRGATFGPILAACVGIFTAVLFSMAHKNHPAGPTLTGSAVTDLFSDKPVNLTSARDTRQLDQMKPQKQAEALLELAVRNSDGAVEQISSRVDRWHGKVQWNSQIANLTTAALDSKDMRVRESGVEVELAAYGLSKNSASLEYLLKTADSPDHARKIWALWALGLMANRGVESERIVQVLVAHLQDSDEDSRHWAVESLALTGADQAITALLSAMHDDPSARVRGRAACGIAEAGLFTPEQRYSAIPQLLNYTDDPSLDAQTHGWAFHALRDITHQQLPDDAAAWREWYESTSRTDN